MNGPFQVAQADTSGTGGSGSGSGDKQHPRIVKITKPYGDQSVVVSLSYDGSVKADLSSIASEKITLVHIGEKLIILFDNHSTVTLEPFFDSTGKPLQALTVEVAPGRDITSAEFATLFPVTDDQSVLPAAGAGSGSGAQASGAHFTSPSVDPLAVGNPLALLGPDELPNPGIDTLLASVANNQGFGPTPGFSLSGEGVVEDETSGVQSADGANDQLGLPPFTPPAGTGPLIGWAQSHGPIVSASKADFGTGGVGTITYALTIAGGPNGVDSHLKATVSGNEIFLYTVGGLVVGREGTGGVPNPDGKVVFALYLEPGSLKLDVAQYGAVSHPDTNNPNDSINLGSLIHVTQTVTAHDGETATATSAAISITFLDDGPTLSVTAPGVINGFDFGNFTPNENAWGNGSGVATGHNGGWTIADANDGHAAGDQVGNTGSGTVQLERVGDGYQGMHSSSNGNMVDLDASPHDVKISQTVTGLVAGQEYDLRFEAGAPFPNSAHLEVWFGGVRIDDFTPNGQMTAYDLKITGGSGDGSNLLEFRETGTPDYQGTYLANVSVGEIVIDETAGNQPGTNDVDPNTLFDAVANKGHDGHMLDPQFAAGISPAVKVAADFGTDGPWHNSVAEATVYSLSTTINGTDSGLMTTAGQEIFLFNETYNGVQYVVGRYGSGDESAAAFAFRIDPTTGVLSLVQYVSLHQPDTLSNNEGVFLNTGVLSATVTVTDGDGDTATQSADISANIRFDDDGPTALDNTVDVGKVYEDGLTLLNSNNVTVGNPEVGHTDTSVTIHATDLAQLVNFGADGRGGFGFNASASDATLSDVTSDGFAIHYAISGDTLSGVTTDGRTVFTLVHQPGGDFVFTLTGNIDHPANGDTGTLTLNLASLFTATDGDGDSVVLNGGLNVTIENDVPVVTAQTNLVVNGSFEQGHDELQAGQWSIYHTLSGTWTSADTSNGNVPFEVQVNNLNGSGPGGVPAEDGQALIELDSDLSSGNLSGDDHVNGTGHTNSTIQQVIAGTEAGQTYELTFWYAPRPGEGDADSGSMEVLWNGQVVKTIDSTGMTPGVWQQITVFVEGTGPGNVLGFHATGQENSLGALIDNVSLVAAVAVDEDGLSKAVGDAVAGNNDSQPGDVIVPNDDHAPVAGGDSREATATGLLDIKWGADSYDKPDSYSDTTGFSQDASGRSLTFTDSVVSAAGISGSALTSHGDAVTFALAENDTRIIGTATDSHGVSRTVIEITLSDDNSGAYHVVLKDALDHASGQNENNIALSFNYTATDSDGDSVPGTFSVVVNDDMPVAHNDSDSVSNVAPQTLDFEDVKLPNGDALQDGQETPLPAGYHSFNITQGGVYNPGGGTYAPHSGENLAFIGEKNGSSIDGYTGNPGDPITIRHVDGTNFTAVGAWFSSNSTEPLTLLFTAYDDNNQVIGSFTRDVHTGPGGGPTYVDMSSLGSVDHITIDSPGGANNNYFGFDDFTYIDAASASGNVITGASTNNPAAGADMVGADGAVVAGVAVGNTGANLDSAATVGHLVHGSYGDLTLNEDGSYSYARSAGSAGGADDVFTYTIKDGDGDLSHATLTIHIDNSTPTIGNNTPDGGGDTAQVYEAGLAATTADRTNESAGSHVGEGAYPTTAGGTIAFTSVDGVGAVKLNDTALSTNSGNPTVIHDGTTGDLSAWYSYNAATGVGTIHYSYTLLDNTLADPSPRSFSVAVTDADGDTATPGTLTINIADDAPSAHDLASQSVAEGATITGNLDFVQGADAATVTQVNGTTLVFGGDGYSQVFHDSHGDLQVKSDGTYKFVAQTDDVYNDGGTVSFNYTVTDGDGDTSTAQGALNVTDTQTPVTVSLSASTANEDAADTNYVFTAMLSAQSHGDTMVHTMLGDITIADGQTTGTVVIASNNGPDVYVDGSSLTNAIISVTGGNFEQIDPDTTSVTATVTDTQTPEQVTLTASSVTEGAIANYTFTATLADRSHGATTVTIIDGLGVSHDITIADGQTTGHIDIASGNGEDVYKDASSLSAHITNVTGGNFEHPVYSSADVTATVADTTNTVTATLTAGDAVYGAAGVTITYTVTLTSSDGLSPVVPTDNHLEFTLQSGQTVQIMQNATSGTVDVTYDYGTFGSTITNSITGQTGDGEYENLVTTGSPVTDANTVPTGGGSVSLTLSEAALDTIQDPPDLHAGVVKGTDPSSTGETAQATSGITFTATGEDLTLAFDPSAAPTVTGLDSGYSLSWSLSGGELVGNLIRTAGNANLGAFVYLTLDTTSATAGATVTPTVTATLVDNLFHSAGTGPVTIGDLQIVATDTSGDHVTGTVNLTINDDAPVFGTPDHGIVTDQAGSTILGDLHLNFGADGANATHALSLAGNTVLSGLTLDGTHAIHYAISANGDTLTGYVDNNSNSQFDAGDSTAFTLALDASIGNYTFTLDQQLTNVNKITGSTSHGGGPHAEYNLMAGGQEIAVVSGSANISGSSDGWKVGTGNFDPTEKMHFDFIDEGNASSPEFAYFTFSSSYKDNDKIDYTVHYADGHSDTTGSFDPSDYSSSPLKLGLEGETISYVEFTDTKGSGKVSLVSVESAVDVTHDLSFNVTATDGDGDTTTGHIGIHIDGSSTLSGTTGADVFGIGSHGGVETIIGFDTSQGDEIDLSSLLNSVFSAGASESQYVKLAAVGNDVHVQVDATGNGQFGTSHDVAVLSGFVSPSHGDIINAIFSGQEHQLQVT